jgi:multiple sugar transport system substrate-binding protein
MHKQVIVLAAALAIAPVGARAADLVVWWQKGWYGQEDEALREIIAAFEQESGKQVDVTFYEQAELPDKIVAAFEVGQPPDFAFGDLLPNYVGSWAVNNRLVDLSTAIGAFSHLFDPDTLAWVTWRDANTGQPAVYGLPIGREINHVHLWKGLLEETGFTLADVPREWEAFWSFWCDRCSRRYVRPRGARTSGGSRCPCRSRVIPI